MTDPIESDERPSGRPIRRLPPSPPQAHALQDRAAIEPGLLILDLGYGGTSVLGGSAVEWGRPAGAWVWSWTACNPTGRRG